MTKIIIGALFSDIFGDFEGDDDRIHKGGYYLCGFLFTDDEVRQARNRFIKKFGENP